MNIEDLIVFISQSFSNLAIAIDKFIDGIINIYDSINLNDPNIIKLESFTKVNYMCKDFP